MQKARTLLILGTWVAILPYLGFPYAWKNTLFTLTGLGLMYFAYILYKEFKITLEGKKTKAFDNFSENKSFNEKSETQENTEPTPNNFF